MLFLTGHDGPLGPNHEDDFDALKPSSGIVGSAGTGRLHD
jgi:hypothetical protein